jgi:hypothetical protein
MLYFLFFFRKDLWKFLFEYGKLSHLYGVEAIVFRPQETYETSFELFARDRKNGKEISMGDQRRAR